MSTTGWVVLGIIVVLVSGRSAFTTASSLCVRGPTRPLPTSTFSSSSATISFPIWSRPSKGTRRTSGERWRPWFRREVPRWPLPAWSRRWPPRTYLLARCANCCALEILPDLKANQNFQQLQAELSDIENKLAASRRFFNNAVQEYNTGIQQFPASLFAGTFGFLPRTFFDLGEGRTQLEQAPSVKF